ncbi:hypothetical protein ACJJTC_014220 [Scirpophaga incertulas]
MQQRKFEKCSGQRNKRVRILAKPIDKNKKAFNSKGNINVGNWGSKTEKRKGVRPENRWLRKGRKESQPTGIKEIWVKVARYFWGRLRTVVIAFNGLREQISLTQNPGIFSVESNREGGSNAPNPFPKWGCLPKSWVLETHPNPLGERVLGLWRGPIKWALHQNGGTVPGVVAKLREDRKWKPSPVKSGVHFPTTPPSGWKRRRTHPPGPPLKSSIGPSARYFPSVLRA